MVSSALDAPLEPVWRYHNSCLSAHYEDIVTRDVNSILFSSRGTLGDGVNLVIVSQGDNPVTGQLVGGDNSQTGFLDNLRSCLQTFFWNEH